MFFGGAVMAYFLGSVLGPFANFHERVGVWLHPFADANNTGFQLVQSLLGLGTGGLFGAGPGAGQPTLVPEVRNDFIFAGIGEEIGLFGLTALLIVYLIIVAARSAGRDRRPRLVRQAARRRPRVHARVAGLRYRRRHHQAHSADRPDHAVHVRRWIVADGELAIDRDAAAHLRRRAPAGPAAITAGRTDGWTATTGRTRDGGDLT